MGGGLIFRRWFNTQGLTGIYMFGKLLILNNYFKNNWIPPPVLRIGFSVNQTSTTNIDLLLVWIRTASQYSIVFWLQLYIGPTFSRSSRIIFLESIQEIFQQFLSVHTMRSLYHLLNLFSILSTHIILLFFKLS